MSETLELLDGFDFFPYRTVQEMQHQIERLKAQLPTLAVVIYNKPVGPGPWSEHPPANEMLSKFLRDQGVILVMEIGDPFSRVKSEHFYSQIQELNIQAIISNDRACGNVIMEEFEARGIRNVQQMIWLPWFTHPRVNRDYGLPITRTLLFVGRPDEPLRRKVVHYGRWANLLTLGGLDFEVLGHVATHEDYSRRLNSSLASFGLYQGYDTHKGHPIGYTFPKYFEIPGCRTLLLAQETLDMPTLGFQDGVNFMAVRPDNFRSVIRRVRMDRKKSYLQDITWRGYDLVHRHHTVEQRVACLFGDLIQFAARKAGKSDIADRVEQWTRARRPWLAGNVAAQ